MPQPSCNLLNGTQEIGPLRVTENCKKKGAQELLCQFGTALDVWNVSQLPLHWTPKEISCDSGLGCQDTMVLIESGSQVSMVLSKGCTEAKDQEPRVTEHRMGPGLSVLSYTYVCRHKDFCNNLVTTAPLWTPQPPAEPGSLRCPVCLSMEGCPEGTTEEMCPKGTTHCYNGLLRLRGGGIFSNLRVQGCMPQPSCNLLNGTQEIGPLRVTENCNTKDFLTCHRGNSLQKQENLTQVPIGWTISNTSDVRGGPGVSGDAAAHRCRSHIDPGVEQRLQRCWGSKFPEDLQSTQPLLGCSWPPMPTSAPQTCAMVPAAAASC
ncbi:hypothetical protein H8959_003462 [Pygathrix nigripes]